MTSWTARAAHRAWLDAEARRLLDFVSAAAHPAHGFAWLDAAGAPVPEQGVRTWITCRVTHVAALAHLEGVPGAGVLADHGLRALAGPLRDPDHGGWFAALDAHGRPVEPRKEAYQHAFVLLAASSAALAGRPGARELLDAAADVVERRFWDEAAGRCRESWAPDWSADEPYRGANSNMHLVEAFLAVFDATGERVWAERALRMARFFVHEVAAARDWRLPEHFDATWTPDLELNADRPADPFKPYGATVGHGLEWSRLLLHLEGALGTLAPSDLRATATVLFDRAMADGWAVDGAEGFVYTTDWSGAPVVRERMHWVVAEAIAAADALHRRTGDARYADLYATWWDYAVTFVVDHDGGSWHHELDPTNRPAGTTWPGKPDLYHAVQATLLPRLPLGPSIARAVHDGQVAP